MSSDSTNSISIATPPLLFLSKVAEDPTCCGHRHDNDFFYLFIPYIHLKFKNPLSDANWVLRGST